MKIIAVLLSLACFTLQAKVNMNFGARMELDYSVYDDDYTYFISDDVNLRRLRGDIYIKFNKRWSVYYQTDISDYQSRPLTSTQAAWLRYRINSDNEFYAGKMEMPFSLESVSNSKYHFFMERSIASALTERFGVGINYIHYGDNWNLRLGVFGDDHYHMGSTTSYGHSVTSRFGKKVKLKDSDLYIGASLQYRKPEQFMRVRTRPESQTYNARLLNTGEIYFVNNLKKYGVEAMWLKDGWAFQGEYIENIYEREFSDTLYYKGGYLIFSKMFNGTRRFNFKKGEWKSAKTKKYRAWEISGRYSYLDLNSADLFAGTEENLSIGINYYLTNKNRLMFNAIRAKATPNSSGVHEALNIYQLRLQFEI